MRKIFTTLAATLVSTLALSQNSDFTVGSKNEDLALARKFFLTIVDANTYAENASTIRKKIEQSCKVQTDSKFDIFSSSPLEAFYTCNPETHVNVLGMRERGNASNKQVVFVGIRMTESDFDWVWEIMIKKFGKKYQMEDFGKTLPADNVFDKFRGTTRYTWSLGRDRRVLHGFNRYISLERDVLHHTVTIELAEDEVSGD